MLKRISNRTKKIICVTSFSLSILIFLLLIYLTIDGKQIRELKDFIHTDTKILYVTEDDNLDYPIKIMDRYSINYLKISISELTIFERKKIEKITDSRDFKNVLVIYENGEIKDKLFEHKDKESVNKFLQDNNIIPNELVDYVDKIMIESQKLLESSYSMVYIPYKKLDNIENQDEIFKQISEEYSIDYKKIDAYLLSSRQQEKINSLLGISTVENQILILVKDNKMIANIRGPHRKNTYIETLYDVNFIDELENKVNEIDYNSYKELLNSNEKNVIVIGTENNKDSNDVISNLNKIIYNYDIEVNYINIENVNSDLSNKVKEKIENIGYTGGFSIPLVVIVESGKVLDFAIGNSSEEYFIDIFIENGVIKGDAING
jgi:hypothetical protein